MYAAIIAMWTQALITAMTIPAPIGLRLRETETTSRKVQGAIPVEPSIRPDIPARQEPDHQRRAVVLAFPRSGVAAIPPNAEL